jgi:stage V sporulation protein K
MNNNSNSTNTNINKNKMDDPNQGYEPFNQNKNRKHRKQHRANKQEFIADPKTIHVNHYHFGTNNSHPDSAKEIIDKFSLNKPVLNSNHERFTPFCTVSNNGSPTEQKNKSPTFNAEQFDSGLPDVKFVHVKPIPVLKPFEILEKLREKIIQEEPIKEPVEESFEEVIIEDKIAHITDLIDLSAKHIIKPKVKYSIELEKLHKIVPHLKELNEMIGMDDIKKSLTYQLMYFLQGFEFKHMLHTIIEGPPGVGQTCLGKILGKIYLDLDCINKDVKPPSVEDEEDGHMNFRKLITLINQESEVVAPKKNIFKIAKRSDLVGQYVGHTAIKTQKIINSAFGGVLFIDEAYSLGGDDAFSKECINTINQNLSENGDKFICIIAGYSDALENSFFSLNSGLHRRFPFRFKINKYTGNELTNILLNKIKKEKYRIDDGFEPKLSKYIEENKDYFPNFGGDIETYFFHVKMMHSTRVFGKPVVLRNIFIKDDFVNALGEMKKNQKKDEMKLDMYS